jgi:selenocysteine-specific translation elongation factor
MPEEKVGEVTDFFARPVVAAIQLTGSLKVGDKVVVKGHSTNVEFSVGSMQIHNAVVTEAKAGDGVGIKVPDRVRKGDAVYKVVD